MLQRRRYFGSRLLGACTVLLAGVTPPVLAHTPYKQWQVYRRKHLLIGCHRQDMHTYALAKQVVAVLDHELPAARARVARGPAASRIASLMGTDQMDVAIIGADDAVAISNGSGPFKAYGAIALRRLYQFDKHVLVSRADFPDKYAWLLASALSHMASAPENANASESTIPRHPGAQMFAAGKPVPK